jgi:hypothetical protein
MPSMQSVAMFCADNGLSRSLFYRLLKEGRGPRVTKIGRRRLIAATAAAEWRARMERETQQAARSPKASISDGAGRVMATRPRRKHPITNRDGRPPNFPPDEGLERLFASNFDPDLGYFELRMQRRHARDLRRELFGSKGLREVPDEYGGVMKFRLPNGWTLRLTYYEQEYDYEERHLAAGDVDAEFVPPTTREQPAGREREECYAEETSR